MKKLHKERAQYGITFRALKRDDDNNKIISLHLVLHACSSAAVFIIRKEEKNYGIRSVFHAARLLFKS
jgi:hypothetical protein